MKDSISFIAHKIIPMVASTAFDDLLKLFHVGLRYTAAIGRRKLSGEPGQLAAIRFDAVCMC